MKKLSVVGVYSVIHCIVDMACAMLIAGILTPIVKNQNILWLGVLLYNLFAFAFQLPFGIVADKYNKNAIVSVIGCLFIILAYITNPISILACVLAGIGNALFHVGGGIDVLNISEKKATLPGIYVATGALGLYIGSKTVYLGFDKFYLIIILLILSILAMLWLYKQVKGKYNINNEEPVFEDFPTKKNIIMYCLLFTICMRGYLGLILNFDWKASFEMGLVCVTAVVLGKMLGGILGDKFGWRKTSMISLLLSAIFFIFAFNNSVCGVLAMLFFNMTMPITLTVLSNTFNSNKGMAFGLTTLALFIGAVPVLFGYTEFLFNGIGLSLSSVLSAIALYIGLKKYETLE